MKRTMPWSDEDDDSSSEDESSPSSASEAGEDGATAKPKAKGPPKHKDKASEGKSGKRKSAAVDFDALKRHGFKGGPSVLGVPAPEEKIDPDWSWSTGKDGDRKAKDVAEEESYQKRQKTRAAIADGEQLINVQTRKDKKNLSFSQKEKRKRELGQASRGKNYVEEEKRLLRDNGIYSGFDS